MFKFEDKKLTIDFGKIAHNVKSGAVKAYDFSKETAHNISTKLDESEQRLVANRELMFTYDEAFIVGLAIADGLICDEIERIDFARKFAQDMTTR